MKTRVRLKYFVSYYSLLTMAFLILQTSIRLMLEIYPAVPFNFLSVPKVKLIKSNVFYESSENIVLLDATAEAIL